MFHYYKCSETKLCGMKPLVACCGLTCTLCDAYIAKRKDDDELRRRVAEKWSKVINAEIRIEQVNCDGCTSEGERFFFCQSCEKRNCCMERHLENCAYCPDYPCKKLNGVFEAVPGAKTTLDEIRKQHLTHQSQFFVNKSESPIQNTPRQIKS